MQVFVLHATNLLRRTFQSCGFYYLIAPPGGFGVPGNLWRLSQAEVSKLHTNYGSYLTSSVNAWDAMLAGILDYEGVVYHDLHLPCWLEDTQLGVALAANRPGPSLSRNATPCVSYGRSIYLCLYTLLPVEFLIVLWCHLQRPIIAFRDAVEMSITLVWGWRYRYSRIHRLRYFWLATAYNLVFTGNQDPQRVRLRAHLPANDLQLRAQLLRSHLHASLGQWITEQIFMVIFIQSSSVDFAARSLNATVERPGRLEYRSPHCQLKFWRPFLRRSWRPLTVLYSDWTYGDVKSWLLMVNDSSVN